MRNAALAVWIAFTIAFSFISGSIASAQTPENDRAALDKLWAAVSEAAKTRNVDIENKAFHWIFLISTSGNDSNNAVAQSERNLLRNCVENALYHDNAASDTVTIVPYQNRVRDTDVHSRLTVGTPEADAKTIATYLPGDVKEEANDQGKVYAGGHDTEAAIAWTLDPKREDIVKRDERNFILVSLGPTDRSNQPTNAAETNFQSYLKLHPQEYRQILDARGIASGKPVRDFASYYEDKGKHWRIYGSVYLPANLTGTPFASVRPHLVPKDTPPVPPPATNNNAASKTAVTPPPLPTPIDQHKDSGATGIIIALLVAGLLGIVGLLAYFRPVYVDVQVGAESSKEPVTVGLRQKSAYVYGPNTKDADKIVPGVTLKSPAYENFPPGKLAEINHVGGKKVRVKRELCEVKGMNENPDGSVTLKAGDVEKLSFVHNGITRSVSFEVR